MSLRLKFNLLLLVAAALGLAFSAALGYGLLHHHARLTVVDKAQLMMENALSIRNYTARELRPLLMSAPQAQETFLPQTVAAYAAATNFQSLRESNPDYAHYTYKEAALNPTNLRDRATDWEADIIQSFRNNPALQEVVVERDTPTGRQLHLARPIQITQESCLACHSRPEAAPATMLAIYGSQNGFGWQLNEIIGAQVVTVPMTVPVNRAMEIFWGLLGVLALVFTGLVVVLNLLLSGIVIRPVTQMAQVADAVSLGHFEIPEYVKHGKDEISQLSVAFNRMRRSLENALKLLEKP